MKKLLVFMALILASFTLMPAYAKPDLVLKVEPEPAYNQMWAFETYVINITLTGLNASEYSEYNLSGRIIADGIVRWRETGQYHHGEGVTGYSLPLDNRTVTLNARIEDPSFKYNLTLSKDAYLYWTWPFENVEILLSVDVFLEEENGTGIDFGPRLGSVSSKYILMDDDKVEYIEGKLLEMAIDVHAAIGVLGLPDFNRTKYESMVSAMNTSIISGNYVEALDQWERWDNKERLRMLNAFSRHVGSQAEEFERVETELEDIETELEDIEMELERVQIEFGLIEDKYFALLANNRRTISELESTKQGLTTAITGIFLSAIVFFFLGRRSNKVGDE